MTLSFWIFLAMCAFVVCVVVALGLYGTIFDHFPDAGKMVNPFGAGGGLQRPKDADRSPNQLARWPTRTDSTHRLRREMLRGIINKVNQRK